MYAQAASPMAQTASATAIAINVALETRSGGSTTGGNPLTPETGAGDAPLRRSSGRGRLTVLASMRKSSGCGSATTGGLSLSAAAAVATVRGSCAAPAAEPFRVRRWCERASISPAPVAADNTSTTTGRVCMLHLTVAFPRDTTSAPDARLS
jgi:hypothetical protein